MKRDALFERLAILAIVGGLLPFGAMYWWVFELLSHFRVQYVGLGLLLLVIIVVRRRLLLSAVLASVVVANAWWLLPYLPSAPVAGDGTTIDVVTINVNAGNNDYERITAAIRAADADVVAILELKPGLENYLQTVEDIYPFRFSEASGSNFGIGILSRYPLLSAQIIQVLTTPAIDAVLELSDRRRLRFVAAHLVPPIGGELALERNDQLTELARIVGADASPLVVCGDFNLSPYSPYFRRFLGEAGLEDAAIGLGLRTSWPSFLPFAAIPIDHCMLRGPVEAERVRRLARVGSDHYPVQVSLRWTSTP